MPAHSRLQTIILTSRIAKAERFYTDVLGLKLRRHSNDNLIFDVGGSDLTLGRVLSTQPSEHTVAGFAVDDLDDVVTELGKRGITWERIRASHTMNEVSPSRRMAIVSSGSEIPMAMPFPSFGTHNRPAAAGPGPTGCLPGKLPLGNDRRGSRDGSGAFNCQGPLPIRTETDGCGLPSGRTATSGHWGHQVA